MRAILRQDGEDRPIDLDLEEEIRAGRIRARDELLYAPWTGPDRKSVV